MISILIDVLTKLEKGIKVEEATVGLTKAEKVILKPYLETIVQWSDQIYDFLLYFVCCLFFTSLTAKMVVQSHFFAKYELLLFFMPDDPLELIYSNLLSYGSFSI